MPNTENQTVYSIYDYKLYSRDMERAKIGDCLVDGYDKQEVVERAENLLSDRAEENGEYGEREDYYVLVTTDADGKETYEQITLQWCAERDSYQDDVRWTWANSVI